LQYKCRTNLIKYTKRLFAIAILANNAVPVICFEDHPAAVESKAYSQAFVLLLFAVFCNLGNNIFRLEGF